MLLIGKSMTWPTDIFLKKKENKLRAVRVTNFEKLDTLELRELSQEILIQRKLRSPYIAEILSCLVRGYNLMLELEYFAFGSCCDLVSAHFKSGLPVQAVVLILRGVCRSLQYCHDQKIIHRSVRASHVFVTQNGDVKLSGFRYAVELINSHGLEMRRSHEYKFDPVGLPWKAPELLEQNCAGYNQKIDIYSLGIFLCELINGVVPYTEKPPTLIMLEKMRGCQPLVMDKSTIGDEFAHDSTYDVYKNRKISKYFHKLVEDLTNKRPEIRPSAKSILKMSKNFGSNLETGSLTEKLFPLKPMTNQSLEKQLELSRERNSAKIEPSVELEDVIRQRPIRFDWDYTHD